MKKTVGSNGKYDMGIAKQIVRYNYLNMKLLNV